MTKINLDKHSLTIIDQQRLLNSMGGHPVASREEMLKSMLKNGIFLREENNRGQQSERGVIYMGADGKIEQQIFTACSWPKDSNITRLMKRDVACIVFVFGEPGSGVTTYMKDIINHRMPGFDVFDEYEKINIARAVKVFEQGGKAIAALSSFNSQDAYRAISNSVVS